VLSSGRNAAGAELVRIAGPRGPRNRGLIQWRQGDMMETCAVLATDSAADR